MSEPHEPTPDGTPDTAHAEGASTAAAAGPTGPLPPQADTQPSTEPEPAPSTASAAEPPPGAQPPPGMPPGAQAGHYVFVPAGTKLRANRFGPGFGRFVRNRGTHLVAAVVVGAVVGGGTVAIVDNIATQHQRPQISRVGQAGGPFGGRSGHRFPGSGFGGGGQGFGN